MIKQVTKALKNSILNKVFHLSDMPNYTTELRTYVGEPATAARNGFAGFRLHQQYFLRYRQRPDGKVAIALDHEHYTGAGREIILSIEEFERWFICS